jgi:hypothetical protein
MKKHLNDFIDGHPDGWNHDEWLGLLGELDANGVDVSDPASLGVQLEKERVAWTLRRCEIPGLGPKRIEAVAEHFGTLWNLRHAELTDFAEIGRSVPAKVAEKVLEALR